ncbi:MAG: ATP phosphoribosyltransferase regulatory subunit [Herpetosiphonaceae bacterium]|nr:ATP phosphoribosyltransferase regulatory subunit [Herpetosiphonaceae bacterium]
MIERSPWQPVRGTRDVLPLEQAQLAAIGSLLDDMLNGWGYQAIDLPLLEQRELYFRKAGEELAGKLYDFVHHGRALALRPEWTASVLRAYLRALQTEPLPVRLRYAGPVFRYERPQRGTYRQFTQVGVELIGGMTPQADAEVLALACGGLNQAGVTDWQVVIGHVGVARSLLAGLGLAERTVSRLLWSLERLRREGTAGLRAELLPSGEDLFDLGPMELLNDEQLQALLLTMLRAVGVPINNSTRTPETIVARLVRKLRRNETQGALERALDLLLRLAAARGTPAAALASAAELLRAEGLSSAPLGELEAILADLVAGGIPPERLTIDLGMSRGLHYYTGMIFEIAGADGLQLCGGGRYDELLTALGSNGSVPAVGFAYGLERVAAAARPRSVPAAPLLLVMTEEQLFGEALHVAEQLRDRGYVAQLDVRRRSLQANLRDATKRGAHAVVEVAGDGEVIWHDPHEGPRRGPLAVVVPVL